MNKVLLIDDDIKLGRLLREYVQRFDLELLTAATPEQGFKLLERSKPDLIVLDIMLPQMDGFEVCRRIRANTERYGNLPIIMLTARGEVADRVVGLELGADDYLAKPFEPRELVARIQSVLRRTANGTQLTSAQYADSASHILHSNGLLLDCGKRSAILDDKALELTTMEYELLCIFMQSPGKTFNRDELMNALRGINAELYSRAVDTLVSRLRHKLADTKRPARFIKTVWGRGYIFVGERG